MFCVDLNLIILSSFIHHRGHIECPLCRSIIFPVREVFIVRPILDRVYENFAITTFHGQVINLAEARIQVYGDNQLARRIGFGLTLSLELNF